jgi:hypothetical protein
VNGALFLGRLSNGTPRQKAIGHKAERALERIANENALNRIRVRKYGVVVGNPEVQDPGPEGATEPEG